MKFIRLYNFWLMAPLLCLIINADAVTLFEDDFENLPSGQLTDPLAQNPYGTPYTWRDDFDPTAPDNLHMPSGHKDTVGKPATAGRGDIFSRNQVFKHSGRSSLRIRFDGRNNFCNICFDNRLETTITSVAAGAEIQTSDDLSTMFPSLPDNEARIWNKSDYFALWQAEALSGGTLSFVNDSPVQNDMGGDGNFEVGDEIIIGASCPDGERRSDCNRMINYMVGVSNADFPPGETLARRFYVYIPSTTILPSATFKFAYLTLRKNGRPYGNELNLSTGNNLQMRINHRRLNGEFHFLIQLTRDVWYYIEDVWTRESVVDGNDGTYELYVHPISEPTNTPILSKTGLTMGTLEQISIVGNRQSNSDAIGSVYFDDIKIATGGRIGPIGNDITPLPPIELE